MGTLIFLVSVIVLGVVTYYTFREKPAADKAEEICHPCVEAKKYNEFRQRINSNLPTMKSTPPPPPRPVYKAPVSRTGWSSSRDPRELGNSDIADDLLLNPISPVSIWHSSDDSHSSSWSNDSSSSYDSGSSDSGGADCGGGD